MSEADLNDWMRGIEGILRQQRKDLNEIKENQAGMQRYLNSSEVLAALARGVQRHEAGADLKKNSAA